MSTLETRIDGSAAGILAVAAWLQDSLSAGATTMDESVFQQYRQVGGVWEGDAAEGLHRRLSTLSEGAETLSATATNVAHELEALATALQSAQADMASARSQAVTGGLTVAGTVIHGPGTPSPDVPTLAPDATPAQVSAHDQGVAAIRAYEATCAVWEAVAEIVEAAQQRWQTAVDTAVRTWEVNAANLAGLVSGLLTAGVSASAMSVVAFNASQLRAFHLQSATDYAAHVRAVTSGGRITTSAAHYYDLLDSGAQHLDDAARLADDIHAPRLPTNVGRGLLVLGVAATGYGIYDDIQHGESPAQAAVSNGAGFAASLGAGALIGAGIGSVIPVGGTIVGGVVGAVVGAGVGIITSGMIDSMWENGVDDLGDVGSAIADGWDEMYGTVGDAKDLVGDAAGAVGGGIKDAWNAIF